MSLPSMCSRRNSVVWRSIASRVILALAAEIPADWRALASGKSNDTKVPRLVLYVRNDPITDCSASTNQRVAPRGSLLLQPLDVHSPRTEPVKRCQGAVNMERAHSPAGDSHHVVCEADNSDRWFITLLGVEAGGRVGVGGAAHLRQRRVRTRSHRSGTSTLRH